MGRQWEDDLRKRLERHEVPAPELSWTDIDRALASRRTARGARLAALGRIRRIAAAAAVVGVVGGAGVYFAAGGFQSGDPANSTMASAAVSGGKSAIQANGKANGDPTSPTDKSTSQDNIDMTHAANSVGNQQCLMTANGRRGHQLAALGTATGRGVACCDSTHAPLVALAADSAANRHEATTTHDGTLTAEQASTKTDDGAAHQPRQYRYSDLFADNSTDDLPMPRPRREPQVSVGAYMANAFVGNSSSSVQPLMLASASPYDTDGNSIVGGSNPAPIASPEAEERRNVSHRQPMRVGLGVGLRLADRLQLNVGLSYSYLHSDISYTTGNERRSTVQRLHYVGIPFGVAYTVWANRRFNVYASAGGAVEHMVSGSADTQSFTADHSTGSLSESVHIGGLQWSACVAAGAEWLFAPSMALYAEPGLGYHFGNGSGVSTIYSDLPLNFSLSIGVRMKFK